MRAGRLIGLSDADGCNAYFLVTKFMSHTEWLGGIQKIKIRIEICTIYCTFGTN
jgi:hypothetical protein